MESQKGTCLCGKITLTTKSLSKNLGACHCGMCRKWSAGPFLTTDCGQDITIEGEENIVYFNSSDWAERAFCKNCGSNLFYRLKQNKNYFVSAELFNDIDYTFHHQVFIDKKPSYYEFSNETKNMTEEDIFKQFS
ncbi:GFA family protein [Bacteriovoracaceae bacterium]|nr:GFA family protein [Bacteriovoracaceae bacterium]